MSKPKKHHFVPRWYLKRFTDANGYLAVLDRRTSTLRRQRPENVMTITHYYRQLWTPAGIDPNILEKSLGATLEHDAKSAIELLLSAPQTLNDQHMADILTFLELQRFRVPRQAAHAKKLVQSTIFMHCPPKVQKAILTGSLQIRVKDSFRFEYMRMLIGSLNPWFGRMKWEVIKADVGASFITTDSPVSFCNVDFLPPAEAGIGLAGTMVLYPLDSEHLLIMRHPEHTSRHGSASKLLPDPEEVDGVVEVTSGTIWKRERVKKINQVMYQLADRVAVANDNVVLEQCLGT
jgi:hypothetical protein